jgi:hypothetical protein
VTVYGPSITSYDVEDAVRTTLQTWIDSYLLDQERESSGRWALRQIERPKSWQLVTDYHAPTADRRLPCVAIEAQEEDISLGSEGRVTGEFGLNVIVIAKGRSRDETRETVSAYMAAIRLLLLHQGDLDGFAIGTLVGGASTDTVTPAKSKTVAGGTRRIAVMVSAVASAYGGPTEPEPPAPATPDPDSPEYPAHTATHVNVTDLED